MKRRNILKKVGIGSAATVAPLSAKTVSASASGNEYIGVTYDPVTGDIKGEAFMNRAFISNSIKGEITIRNPQFSSRDIELILDQESHIESRVSGVHEKPRLDYKIAKHNQAIQSNYTNDDEKLPLVARIMTIPGECVSGIVRPLGSTNKSAFYLSKKRPSVARNDIRKRIKDTIPILKQKAGGKKYDGDKPSPMGYIW